MSARSHDRDRIAELATRRAVAVATSIGDDLTEVARSLHAELAQSIPELRGDELILELLRASTESNVETFLHVAQYAMDMDDVDAPAAAVEYARRLAQRGISSNALLRAYRLGQRRTLALLGRELERSEPDGAVGLAAMLQLQQVSFEYVDKVAEYVVSEYERERERWLANRSAVRAGTIRAVLEGDPGDLSTAEASLGYRLRQVHLAVIAWSDSTARPAETLAELGQLITSVAKLLDVTGQTLVVAQDDSTSWGWIPLGRNVPELDVVELTRVLESSHRGLRLALGTPGPSTDGFRISHEEAQAAYAVASAAKHQARPITYYGDPEVRACSMLVRDLAPTIRMVRRVLGDLAVDSESAARLRATLRVYLAEKGSFVAAGEILHLHKNTVKYRVDKALEERGGPVGDDRLELELALIACDWLGPSVLQP